MGVNEVGRTEAPFKLTMMALTPTFIKNLEPTQEVTEGTPLTLQCVVDASPLPIVQWYKDNEEVKPSEQ